MRETASELPLPQSDQSIKMDGERVIDIVNPILTGKNGETPDKKNRFTRFYLFVSIR